MVENTEIQNTVLVGTGSIMPRVLGILDDRVTCTGLKDQCFIVFTDVKISRVAVTRNSKVLFYRFY